MKKFIVLGGAGFIGCNLAHRVLAEGHELVVVDDLSRRGSRANLDWLHGQGTFDFIRADIRDPAAMKALFTKHGDAHVAVHLAGQVAVTTSVANPREDFEINAFGTLNILEGIRLAGVRPLLIYASTNKVYGGMENIVIEERETRHVYRDYPQGIPETALLDFHSPYGCSKGAADQYVRDYARIYGLPTVVFRQSCIYGPRQFGIEDQGWVAWFIIAAVSGRAITVYGDGKQVRDVLYIDDLLDAYLAAADNPERVSGDIFNVGGGPDHAMSVWAEFGPLLEELLGKPIPIRRGPWRPGDQPVYISDIRKIGERLGWRPRVGVREGLTRLCAWVLEHQDAF